MYHIFYNLHYLNYTSISQQAKLPLIIIVWSPKETNGDIKLKIVDKINYSENKLETPRLFYTKKILVNFETLKDELKKLSTQKSKLLTQH